jgi:hypothetical protein
VTIVRRSVWLLVLAALAAALAGASPASALPDNPWTGQWRIPVAKIPCAGNLGVTTDQIFTATQSGSRVTFNLAYGGRTAHITGNVSPDNAVFTAGAAPDGWTEDAPGFCFADLHARVQLRMAANGLSFASVPGPDSQTDLGNPVDLPGTYVGGGTEPRTTPTTNLPALCPGADGPWTGRWTSTAVGPGGITFLQRGGTVTGTYEPLNGGGQNAGSLTGTVAGRTLSGSWTEPGSSGTFTATVDPGGRSLTGTTSPVGRTAFTWTATFAGCPASANPAAPPNLGTTIPSPQTLTNGPTTITAPGAISIRSLRRSKCVLVRVASQVPARILVTIYSGRRSIRLFGQQLVRFLAPGRRDVCIAVPFRARTFNVRTRLTVALGYALGARRQPGERRQPVVRKPIRLRP